MTATVAQFVGILERLAPPRLAESWDNVGLQIGSRNWPVSKVWIALDPLPETVATACENDVDLLVTHHPLFFNPLKRIDCESPQGRIAQLALSHQLAIFSAHTNLDSVTGGVNDILASRMALSKLRVLAEPADTGMVKLVVFVPEGHVHTILDSLFALNAGRIGNYACCTFRSQGTGTFLPSADASPAIGKPGVLTHVQEDRVEILVSLINLGLVVDALKQVHPYETMAYDVYPLHAPDHQTGLGRVGELPSPLTLNTLAAKLKVALGVAMVKVAGQPDMAVKTVAVCSGSGASLLSAAIASGANAYVSGDLGHHAAIDAKSAGLGLIDVGHFGSERLVVDVLATSIKTAIKKVGVSAVVETVHTEADPFHYL